MRGGCPSPQPDCPYAEQKGGCFSDEHHLYYPRRDYRKGIDRVFRELPENKEQLCRWEHDQRHEDEWPPKHPSLDQMLGAICLWYFDPPLDKTQEVCYIEDTIPKM